jgi:hypothetical protein
MMCVRFYIIKNLFRPATRTLSCPLGTVYLFINSLGSEAEAAEAGGGTAETGGGAAEAGGGAAEAGGGTSEGGGGVAEGRVESLPTIQHLVGSLANLTNKFANIYRHACSHTQ